MRTKIICLIAAMALILPAAGGSITGSAWAQDGGSILGHVDDGTNPISGGAVWLWQLGPFGDWVYQGWAPTDAGGNYQFVEQPTGQYFLLAAGPGYAGEWYDDTYDQTAATLVPVTASDNTTDIDFSLEPGGSISGHVDDGTDPIGGASILVWRYEPGMLPTKLCVLAETNPNGDYMTLGLPAGQYAVEVRPPGYAAQWYYDTYDGFEATPVDVSVAADTPGIDFTFPLELEPVSTEDIDAAIEGGLAWLVQQQNADGSWGGSWEPVAHTGFALVKLQDRAYELGYESPFDPDYGYSVAVTNGLNYIFGHASEHPWGGICFDMGARETYNTGIAMMVIAASRTPGRSVPSGPFAGQTHKQVLQANVDFFAATQNPDGGWRYVGGDEPSDNSNTGYAVLGLRYAEAELYGFQCTIPTPLKTGLSSWIDAIQDPVDGDPNDGGSWYMLPWTPWVNLLKTGNLLFEMAFVGDDTSTQRVIDALDYIERHWNDPSGDPGAGGTGCWVDDPPGWYPPPQYQAMYCLMKGFDSLDIDTIEVGGSEVDWYEDLATVIVNMQISDGSWPYPAGCWEYPVMASEWALLVLEKVAPPPAVNVEVDVPDCVCDEEGYQVDVTYTVERIPSDGTVVVKKDGGLYDTVILNAFSGIVTKTYNIAADTPGVHTWSADLDVTPTGGGRPAHADDEAAVNICETPEVGDIPDQNTPFESFDLDDHLTYGGSLPVSWSPAGVPAGWAVDIDVGNVAVVTAPAGATDPATITFTASVTCCGQVICDDSDDAVFSPSLRAIKENAKECLWDYVNESKRFEKAIEKIDKSLEPKRWLNETHLDCKHGKKVFDDERYAVKQLMHLLKGDVSDKCGGIASMTLSYTGGAGADITVDKGTVTDNGDGTYTVTPEDGKEKLSANTKISVDGDEAANIHTSCSKPIEEGDIHGDFEIEWLDKIPSESSKKDQVSDEALACAQEGIAKLVSVDRILAETLIIEAEGTTVVDSKNQDKVDKELARAHEELDKGDADSDAGNPDKAITHYKKAWEHACHAIDHATKPAKEEKCHGIASMTLSYTGGAGADITVDKGTVTDNGDGTYTITPEDGKEKLSANTKISVDGDEAANIHTSCSKPIEEGDEHGPFTIVDLDKIF